MAFTKESVELGERARKHILKMLKQGPLRMKPIRDAAIPAYRDKVPNMLYKMHMEGALARKSDGWWKGKPTYVFWIPSAQNPPHRVEYKGHETLRAMQAHARELLGVKQLYIERLMEANSGQITKQRANATADATNDD